MNINIFDKTKKNIKSYICFNYIKKEYIIKNYFKLKKNILKN